MSRSSKHQGEVRRARGESPSRRAFLRASAAAAAGAAWPQGLTGGYVAGSDVIRVGLIGCGGRGTGAAAQALRADQGARLVAMGDAFQDRLDRSLKNLLKTDVKEKVQVDRDHRFTGFDCYRRVIESLVDVVVLASPPHFRPMQIEAAVQAGKHIFAEKPVAVDAPGVRRVMAACSEARQKGLSVVSGLCWRYHNPKRETFNRVLDGALGEITTLQCTYNTSGLWTHPRQPGWSDMEWQIRNWLYFTWLSGDHIVEQHIHSLDKVLWAMGDRPPLQCTGMGGRQVRTDPAYGHIYDHFSVVYDYPGGVKAFSQCRQQDGCSNDVSDHIWGTRGRCDVFRHRILGENAWEYDEEVDAPKNNMYQTEHDELFASIRRGTPINNGDYMCKSTLMAIMGRMSAYTGKTITWEQALGSNQDLSPKEYVWGPLEVPPVALPGVTKFL